MDCKKVSQALELSALQRGSDATDADSAELSEHLKKCSACKVKLIDIREHDLKIKQCMENVKIPEDLRETIVSNSRYSNNGNKKNKIIIFRYLPLTAAIALILISAYFFLGDHILDTVEFNRVIASSITSHNQSMAAQFAGNLSLPKLNQWFAKKPDSGINVPEFGDKLKFLGGKKCKLCCRDAAYLLYSKDNKKISLFIFNGEGFDINLKKKILEHGGKTVALWRDDGLGYCMVMDPGIDDAGAILNCCQNHDSHGSHGSSCSVQKKSCK
ncbi:MAG: DUF3379 domain-containing protein [bacterium]|nr:DUF3379 domain-containing protein [bacterium]